jgi:hypothetical protein
MSALKKYVNEHNKLAEVLGCDRLEMVTKADRKRVADAVYDEMDSAVLEADTHAASIRYAFLNEVLNEIDNLD